MSFASSGLAARKQKSRPLGPPRNDDASETGRRPVQVSPDGQQVAYAVREAVMDDDKSEYVTHIHLASADGSQATQLTRGEKSCDDPQWSPDGRWIAFLSSRVGKKNLWVIGANGGEAQQLSEMKGNVGSFKWSPDGKHLAFTAIDPPTAAEENGNRQKNDARVVDEDVKQSRLYVIPYASPPELQHDARLLTKDKYSVGGEGIRMAERRLIGPPTARPSSSPTPIRPIPTTGPAPIWQS